MSEPVLVRRATASDVPALVALMRVFYAESSYPLDAVRAARTFEHLMAAPELGAVWLVVADGQPGGFVVLTVAFSMEYGGLRGFVDDLFVAPDMRRRGLAAAALDAVRAECVRRGVRALLVETASSNAAALGVYRRAGFSETGRLLMTQPLAEPLHEIPKNG